MHSKYTAVSLDKDDDLYAKEYNFRMLFYYHAKTQRGRISMLWEASRRGYGKLAEGTACFASAGERGGRHAIGGI